MNSRHFTNGNEVISIYRYMELCGLFCEKRKHVRLSHKIMLGKVRKRQYLFTDKIVLPRPATLEYEKEEILTGKIILVKDDIGKILPYYNPLYFREKLLMDYLTSHADKRELKNIRNSILKEQGFIEDKDGAVVNFQEFPYTDPYEYIEKHNRVNSFISRGGRSLKKKQRY